MISFNLHVFNMLYMYVFFVFPYVTHDAFMHHKTHVLDAPSYIFHKFILVKNFEQCILKVLLFSRV